VQIAGQFIGSPVKRRPRLLSWKEMKRWGKEREKNRGRRWTRLFIVIAIVGKGS